MKNERTKSILIYLALIALGLLLGWLLFARPDRELPDHEHVHPGVIAQADVEYTCSMHPQVRQDEPGDCPICGMDLIAVADDDDHQHDDPFLFTMGESPMTWANVRTQRVEAIHAGPTLRLTGKVAVNERETRLITAHFPGRIERLYADYTGRFIREGERLATIYSPELMQAQQELLQAAIRKEEQPRLYRAARERLRLLNLTPAQIEQIEDRGQASATTDVYATRSGYLTRREVSEGDYVSTGQTIFAIAGLSNVWVELDAYEDHLQHIRPGQQASVQIPARPANGIAGQVEFVDPFVNPQTRAARVRLTVANPDHVLKPGMLVSATVSAPAAHQVVVPATAVLWTGKQSVVYVKHSEHNGFTFEFREVETGGRTGDDYIITSGLSEGEEIAVHGVFAIDASAQLRGHFAMMAPPERIELPQPFKDNLESLFNRYFEVKNALADDNPQDALQAGRRLLQQLETTGQHALPGEHHVFWMEQYQAIHESITGFLAEDDLPGLRIHFEPLSEAFIETARTLGAVGQTFHVTFCPMVDEDRGAYWLSEFEEIKNPYWGAMMLRCGEVRETIREGIPPAEAPDPRPMEEHVH